MTVEVLNWIKLPDTLGIERDRKIPVEFRNAAFDEAYDFHTLSYDAIFVPGNRSICLICPKLFNLKAVVKDGLFVANNQRLRSNFVHRQARYDEIWLRCSGVPEYLRFRFGSFECEIPVSIQNKETFKGLWCAVLKSKNNELAWIKDWSEYHVKVHGLQGLVFFDNNSTKYSLEDVNNALLEINGLEKVRVLAAPFPYGPQPNSSGGHSGKFLSTGLYNIARLRYLQSAAAVLLADVDELVAPTPKGSVFALAERSPLGYVSFHGRWHYLETKDTQHIRHKDHIFKSTNNRLIRARKYCICPRGLLRFLRWGTHSAFSSLPMKRAVKKILTTSQVEYWHCRKITTHWKSLRKAPPSDQLNPDSGMKRVLDHVFGSGP